MVRVLRVYPCLFAAALGLAPVVPPRPELPPAVASMLDGASFGTMKTSIATVSSSADLAPSLRGQPPMPLPMTLARTDMDKAQVVEVLSKSQGFSQALPEAKVWSTVAQQPTAARFTTGTFSDAATASASPWIISALLLVPVSAAGLWWRRRAQALRGKNSQTEVSASNSVVWPQQPNLGVAAFCGESVEVGPPPLRSPARLSTNISSSSTRSAAPYAQHVSLPIAASRHGAVRANGRASGSRCGMAAGKAADLTCGDKLTGTVTQVMDHGAFLDLGLDVRGYVHVSNMAEGMITSPTVKTGDTVDGYVKDVKCFGKDPEVEVTMTEQKGKPLSEYKKGQSVTGSVEGNHLRGVWVNVGAIVPALIEREEINTHPEAVMFPIGSTVKAKVKEVKPNLLLALG